MAENPANNAAHVIEGPENAGVIDIGDGDALIFKIESHNHPSFIEPFHGAATGVGGILRDVFTMGARPIALLNALRFGDPSHPKVPHLIDGVVRGIAHYGNCVGVPTVGETQFDAAYNGNNLVNAMAVGLTKSTVFLNPPPAKLAHKSSMSGQKQAAMASMGPHGQRQVMTALMKNAQLFRWAILHRKIVD